VQRPTSAPANKPGISSSHTPDRPYAGISCVAYDLRRSPAPTPRKDDIQGLWRTGRRGLQCTRQDSLMPSVGFRMVANTPGIRSGLFHQAKSTQCPNSNAACRGAAASASPHCWPAEIWGVSYLGSWARRRLGGADSSLAGVRFPAAASNVLQLTALVVADVEASIGFLLRAA